ncbi:MAG: hypothetical protein WA174_14710 [Rhodoferax sp.]
MIKIEYIIGAGLVLMWLKGRKKEVSSNQVQDTIASQQGSDWIGSGGMYAMWDRLNGTDLGAKGYPNLAAGPVADPGKVGQLNAGIKTQWDGTIDQLATIQ